MNILIIDDHAIVKEGIEARIKKVKPEANCYFAHNARGAISKIHTTKIDLVFCDLEFSNEIEKDGFYIIKNILEYDPSIKTIALTNYNSYRIMKKAIKSGFHSFLDKGCSVKEFSETLIKVCANERHESTTMKQLRKKWNTFTNTMFSESLYGISDLSPRERELTLLSAETTDKNKLSKIMDISPLTVDYHFKKALAKLKLKHRKELALFSREFRDEILKYSSK